MFSVGFSEIVMVLVVTVLALKPEQMLQATKMCRKLWVDWCAWRAKFDAEQLRIEKERQLAERIKAAAGVSDVSDLLSQKTEQK